MAHLLIVEDEDFLSRVLKDNLIAEGHTTDVVADGVHALEILKTKTPDLIILDLVLPIRSGFSVLEELKKNADWKTIPVIVLSNLGGRNDIHRAMDLGANEYMVKSDNTIFEVLDLVKKLTTTKT